jgi:hypothetical protein
MFAWLLKLMIATFDTPSIHYLNHERTFDIDQPPSSIQNKEICAR